jgi:hypothetical protein
MGLQHYTQDMSKITLKYHKKVMFYTKYTHPTLICRGTDGRTDGRTHARKIFTQYSGISSCSLGSTDICRYLQISADICRYLQISADIWSRQQISGHASISSRDMIAADRRNGKGVYRFSFLFCEKQNCK